MKSHIAAVTGIAILLGHTVGSARADDVLSSEDWEGATHALDYVNTDYDTSDTLRNAIVSVPASSPGPAAGTDPTGLCGVVRGDVNKYYTLRDPLRLASGIYTSVQISYAIHINQIGINLQLQYSASGDFDDTQVVKTHTGTVNGSGTPYEENRWYAAQIVTLDPETYAFTDTARIRWRPASGSGMSLRRFLDDIVITGIGESVSGMVLVVK